MPLRQYTLPKRITWDQFITTWTWKQGQHVAAIGPTGAGKTTLMQAILPLRDWVVVFANKPNDDSYHRLLAEGYIRAKKWPPPKNKNPHSQYVLLWPEIRSVDDLQKKTPIFEKCLKSVFTDTSWTVGLDDLYYTAKVMGLGKLIEALNYQVRAQKVTLVSGIQRPAWVPRSCWDQSSHAFLASMSDIDDVRALRGLSPVGSSELFYWLENLKAHEWLYLPVSNSVEYPPVIVRPPLYE